MATDRTHAATSWKAITPSDTANIQPTPVNVFVGTGGNVVAEDGEGNQATFTASDGQALPIQPVKILSTGTTATGLIALYNT